MVAAIAFTVFVERAQRRIPIQQARRGGNTGEAAAMSYFPLRVNTADVKAPPATSARCSRRGGLRGTFRRRAPG